MKRTLLLMRHAKSNWPTNPGNDFERSLVDRGHKDARRIGRWIVDHSWVPHHIICSSALRARQTVEHLCEETGVDLQTVDYYRQIYEANPSDLMTMLAKTGTDVGRLLMVGHNPTFSELLHSLCPDSDAIAAHRSMPTAALAVITCKNAWDNVDTLWFL